MISRSLTTIFVYAIAVNVCFAGFWSSLKFWEDERVDTLLVAGNYTRSRLLAELVQLENDSPIILFSPEAFKGKFYYLSDDKKAVEYDIKRLPEFLGFINPKSVMVIGDEKYVGQNVINLLDRSTAPWSSIEGSNWTANAQAAAKHFDLDGLTQEYSRLLLQIYEQDQSGLGMSVEPLTEETPLVEVPFVTEVDETPVAIEITPVAFEEPQVEVVEEPIEIVMPIENDKNLIEFIEQTPQK